MKRIFALFLAALLCTVSFYALAESAIEEADTALFTYEGVFTLNCPIHWEFIPSEPEDIRAYYVPIGILTDPSPTGLVLGMYMMFFEHLKDFNLFEADEEALQKYIADTLADYEPINGIFRETVYAMEDTIPFVIFDTADEYGPCLRAETMFSGWGIFLDLYAYTDESYSACREITEEEYAQFIQILESFLPALPETN